MRYGIPLLGNRVAPRCRCADGILIVTAGRRGAGAQRWMSLEISDPRDLLAVLEHHRVDTVVCGGISGAEREMLIPFASTVIENVAGSVGEVLAALEEGSLRPGFGLTSPRSIIGEVPRRSADAPFASGGKPRSVNPPARLDQENASTVDCIRCRNRKCLRGENCSLSQPEPETVLSAPVLEMLDAAADVSSEEERQLCRLAELVYFCFEMHYRRIGIAYCVDLQEPAEILAGVLNRSFETVGICCKVGTVPASLISCNPLAQVRLLNQAGTDLNVIVGLCMGADCLFARESEAPVTTLFVKDKSLANNPIGAVYSEHYLRESVSRSTASRALAGRPDWWKAEITDRKSSEDASGREDRS